MEPARVRHGTQLDVAIVGAGVIGLTIAWRLLQRGARVRLYDRGVAGRGASWAAAGLLAASAGDHRADAESPLDGLCRRGLAEWAAFAAELEAASGVDVARRTEGTLVVALDEAAVERERAAVGKDAPGQAWLERAEVAAREPALAERVLGARLVPGDHQVDNRRLVAALIEAVRRAGGAIHEGVAATLDVPADVVVLAAGAWSGALAPVGAPLPVRPVMGQMLALRDPVSGPWLRHVVFAPDVYLVPRRDGRLLVGATIEERGFDDAPTADGRRALLDGAARVIPLLADAPVDDHWAGLRPGSADDAPLLGWLADGVAVATGHYRNGILLAPITGSLIAALVCGEAMPAWATAFAPGRF